MALDGAFLRHLTYDFNSSLLGAKVDKVYQPNRDEIVLLFRGKNQNLKLLISSRANSPRINFINTSIENPASPPMFCMLLRKRFMGAKFCGCSQPGLERAVRLEFDTINELGDNIKLFLNVEIMGKYSNIILTDDDNKIIDCIHRVDASMSSQRLVLPGMKYTLPPSQNKLEILESSIDKLCSEITALNLKLSKAILNTIAGISPIICREISDIVTKGQDTFSAELSSAQIDILKGELSHLKSTIDSTSGKPYLIYENTGKPLDFCFIPISQYGNKAEVKEFESFSELLECFYSSKDSSERMRVKSTDILRVLTNSYDRISKKINLQTAELSKTSERNTLKTYGDLLNANLYNLTEKSPFADVQNYYSDQLETVRIPLDPILTPSQNAQKYYKEYRKAQTAEKVLTEQITKGKEELIYIDAVFDSLSRAESEKELNEIRQELAEEGLIKLSGKQAKSKSAALPPLTFQSNDGFKIIVGRNNKQNDRITMKLSNNNDVWFHARNIPGAHTIIITDGKEPSVKAIEFAAGLAAAHSKSGKSDAPVAVDFTKIRNVKKPSGAKPGMVIYDKFETIFVKPLHLDD